MERGHVPDQPVNALNAGRSSDQLRLACAFIFVGSALGISTAWYIKRFSSVTNLWIKQAVVTVMTTGLVCQALRNLFQYLGTILANSLPMTQLYRHWYSFNHLNVSLGETAMANNFWEEPTSSKIEAPVREFRWFDIRILVGATWIKEARSSTTNSMRNWLLTLSYRCMCRRNRIALLQATFFRSSSTSGEDTETVSGNFCPMIHNFSNKLDTLKSSTTCKNVGTESVI